MSIITEPCKLQTFNHFKDNESMTTRLLIKNNSYKSEGLAMTWVQTKWLCVYVCKCLCAGVCIIISHHKNVSPFPNQVSSLIHTKKQLKSGAL